MRARLSALELSGSCTVLLNVFECPGLVSVVKVVYTAQYRTLAWGSVERVMVSSNGYMEVRINLNELQAPSPCFLPSRLYAIYE